MLTINRITIIIFSIGVIINNFLTTEANILNRVKRQSENGNGQIIDNIFNIPITAIKQTAAAAQTFYPENGANIDTVFNIPVATLEAVGNLVKNRNTQRREMEESSGLSMEEIKRRRKERKDQLHAKRKAQRLQQQKKQKQQHNDPFGVHALSDLFFVGHGHGLFNGHNFFGSHLDSIGDHISNHFNNHFGGHGSSHGDGGDNYDNVGEIQGGSSSSSSENENNNGGYEVTEEVDENRKGWGGWFDFGNFFGSSHGSSSSSSLSPQRNPNKINQRPDRRKYGRYDDLDAPLENKIAPKRLIDDYQRNRYDDRAPLENKIAPKNYRTNYQRSYSDLLFQDRIAPKRSQGNDRIVFEHRSF